MHDHTQRKHCTEQPSRRSILRQTLVAGAGSVAVAAAQTVIETDVSVPIPDGLCDAVLFHPQCGTHPGILLWPDAGGLRAAFRDLGRRVASQGYVVLVPNHLYRSARPPIFPPGFDPPNRAADMETYSRITASFFAAGAIERDAAAYVSYLDARSEIKKRKKLGSIGYCLGGMCVMRTAAFLPGRIGAGVSLHGAPLVISRPDSTHLLAPKIKAQLYFAVASDDDQRDPNLTSQLRAALSKAKVRAEIEVYPGALHGWCVPDSKAAANKQAVELAWTKMMALIERAL